MVGTPYISFVVCSRNDTYASDMLLRQQKSLDILSRQLAEYDVPVEFIMVEWNPPADTPRLSESLVWDGFPDNVSCRVITVAPDPHACRVNGESSFDAVTAWNVGIRRARGTYILPKSADTIYSDAVINWIATETLDLDCVYRCDRYDVEETMLSIQGKDAVLASCEDLISMHHARKPLPNGYAIRDLHTNGAGDFLLMERRYWKLIRGFEESGSPVALDVDGLALHSAVTVGAKEVILPANYKVFKPRHSSTFINRVKLNLVNPWVLMDQAIGFFRLPTKWQINLRIRFDYPRRRINGLRGVTFPSYARHFIAPARKMLTESKLQNLNDADWGLADAEVDIQTVRRADWDR